MKSTNHPYLADEVDGKVLSETSGWEIKKKRGETGQLATITYDSKTQSNKTTIIQHLPIYNHTKSSSSLMWFHH